jgi:hypothetical protein
MDYATFLILNQPFSIIKGLGTFLSFVASSVVVLMLIAGEKIALKP